MQPSRIFGQDQLRGCAAFEPPPKIGCHYRHQIVDPVRGKWEAKALVASGLEDDKRSLVLRNVG